MHTGQVFSGRKCAEGTGTPRDISLDLLLSPAFPIFQIIPGRDDLYSTCGMVIKVNPGIYLFAAAR